MQNLRATIHRNVSEALTEDLGDGDLTAALIEESATASATIITREPMTQAGRPWVDEVYRQIDARARVEWLTDDGDTLAAGAALARLQGPARALLSGERTALNFLQTLAATATTAAAYVAAVAGSKVRILDTRKTVPGLRLAQKYAVRCGGGVNHRIGLFDGVLIKENHIRSAGGIEAALLRARDLHGTLPIEIEVESVDEMRQALRAGANRLLLDNFSVEQLKQAVAINRDEGSPPAALEASGGLTMQEVKAVASTGVDYISIGALTKNVRAIDLSMRFD